MAIRINSNIPDHPKVLDAGGAAMMLYIAGACWIQRHQQLDMVIPKNVIGGFPGFDDMDTEWDPTILSKTLVQVGLWNAVDGGFSINEDDHLVIFDFTGEG